MDLHNMDANIIQLVGAIGAMLGGMWMMFQRFSNSNTQMQKVFLEHLEKKNGHTERIANEFNRTVREFQGNITMLIEKVDSIDKRV